MVFAVFIFTFMFGPVQVNLFGYDVWVPYPTLDNSMSAQVFKKIWNDQIPYLTDLGARPAPYASMAGGMITLIYISMFLGVVLGMPMIVYQLNRFISPGLYKHEQRMVLAITLPAVFLFLTGCAFGYFFIIPFIIRFLLEINIGIGANILIQPNDFMSMLLTLMLAFGIVFEIPIIMAGITRLGIVSPDKWLKNWRWAVIGFIIFGAAITPDGSGITQLLVAVPMTGLYFAGYGVSRRMWRKFQAKKGKD